MATFTQEEEFKSANAGFDALFSNDLDGAKQIFNSKDGSVFHLLGLGATLFLQAALGMESGVVEQAIKALNSAESAARAKVKSAKAVKSSTSFPAGTEWEILHADAIILQGLTQPLNESYYGYLQCLYALNSAHSKFTKLQKIVFPKGFDAFKTPGTTPVPSRRQSLVELSLTTKETPPPTPKTGGLFGRFLGTSSSASSSSVSVDKPPEGPLEEMIVSGASFGYGLFNLALSLLPAKLKSVVGFFGYKSSRAEALQSLAVSAASSNDLHAVFSGLETRYPKGTLWILNRAKICRYTSRTDEAIEILQSALTPGVSSGFVQADALLVFELAWTLLSKSRYAEAAEAFLRMTKMNTWSHGTYYILAAGCYVSLKQYDDAQKLLDQLPVLLEKKKIGGKDLPTEVYIRQKLAYWQAKLARKGGKKKLAEVISISPAEELAIIWNTHNRIPQDVVLDHIRVFASYTPHPTIESPLMPPRSTSTQQTGDSKEDSVDLDAADELASRSLLLGILHRTAGEHKPSRAFLEHAMTYQNDIPTSWAIPTAMFELATLDLVEAEQAEKAIKSQSDDPIHAPEEKTSSLSSDSSHTSKPRDSVSDLERKKRWKLALDSASNKLEKVVQLAANTTLSARIESRVQMLRDEIGYKRVHLGL